MSTAPPAVHIRQEQPGDSARIREINESAFQGTVEADLVDALRAAGGIVVSMVGVLGEERSREVGRDGSLQPTGEIVAHALATRVTVSTEQGEMSLLGLGPVAVAPSKQRQGIGTQLIEHSLEWLRACGHPGIVVVGEPGYYERFGFISASRWGLRWEVEAPEENFMALELSPGALAGVSGVVSYRPEFSGS